MTNVEKLKHVYVLASIDNAGKTVYLRSLHSAGQWEIVADIEMATKGSNMATIELMRDFYEQETDNYNTFVIVPLEIEYRLVREDGDV